MKMTKKSGIVFGSAIAGILVFGTLFQNCSAPEIDGASASGTNSSLSTTKFTLVPSTADIMVDGQQTFVISGGSAPYTWSLSPSTCGGFDTASKTFTAASVGGVTCTLSIKDNNNKTVRAVINIAENALLASYSPNPATLSTNIQIQPTGGTPPYTYTKISGNGTLVSSVYKSPSEAESATIRVADTKGNTYDVVISVGGLPAGSDDGGSGTVTIFRSVRAFTGDIMMTRIQNEASDQGYSQNPTDNLTLFTAGGSSRVELERCFNFGMHTVVIAPCGVGSEKGDRPIGFVSKSRTSSASREIFICNNGISQFLTKNAAECGGAQQSVGFAP